MPTRNCPHDGGFLNRQGLCHKPGCPGSRRPPPKSPPATEVAAPLARKLAAERARREAAAEVAAAAAARAQDADLAASEHALAVYERARRGEATDEDVDRAWAAASVAAEELERARAASHLADAVAMTPPDQPPPTPTDLVVERREIPPVPAAPPGEDPEAWRRAAMSATSAALADHHPFFRSILGDPQHAIPNQYAGNCARCGARVEAAKGAAVKMTTGSWRVQHAPGQCPRRVVPFLSAKEG